MTYALAALVGLTVLLCGSVAALADLARERQPRLRPQGGQALTGALWIVQAPEDRWFVNGEPVSRRRLPGLLASQPERTEIRFLPAATLPLGQVSRSLAQLRTISPRPVVLTLPQKQP
ncbi:hypothetical protein [Cyanobium gracile]|uniref:Uncharacterized protein n=1 Tax=Cyanobium gracile UHCC 0281 TaxID=3110309 RepID=A0ABU5SSF8_9CYAN|nr:hypothetical protein [Cyanobium gracile]MEA5441456.1 hypothetical protein [Cyanobium gracile UHCC 0281]